MGGRCSLLNLGSDGQRSSALDIEVKICFPGCKKLSFPLIDTILHIWNKVGKKGTQDFIKPFLYLLGKEMIYTCTCANPLQEFGVSREYPSEHCALYF
jgi:hypothetical protein